jgi:alkanesulfonate monooxygenase SsuD/methylene tetrahydromethanopterin reductase-like flavin-dependent oxidoreductase (luciferase family)
MALKYGVRSPRWLTTQARSIRSSMKVQGVKYPYSPRVILISTAPGKYHKMTGYAATHPSPQRTPTIFQAGASKAGVAFAGKHAEGIYCGVPTIEGLRKYSQSVRDAARAAGRDPSSVKLFSGFCPIVGRTEEEAQEKYARYKANASYLGGLANFCALTGVDLSKWALDEPFDFEDAELAKAGIQGIFNNFKMVEKDKVWTPRTVGIQVAMGSFGPMPVGTPAQVADVMEKWFVEADIDGFNLQCKSTSPAPLPSILLGRVYDCNW